MADADARRFGIDFGTTNPAIAFFDGRELHRPTLDPGRDHPLVLPSLLYIDRQQQSTAGTAAARQYLHNETGRRATWEKRRVGEIGGLPRQPKRLVIGPFRHDPVAEPQLDANGEARVLPDGPARKELSGARGCSG